MNKAWMFRDRDREAHAIQEALFVDPGLGGTGWAFFEAISTKAEKGREIRPSASGVLKVPKPAIEGGSWLHHSAAVAAAFQGLLAAYHPRLVVLEQPGVWSGSAKSYASAATGTDGETGDLFKLSYLVGQLGWATKLVLGIFPVLVMPYEWKGQLSKELVKERLEAYGIEAREHEADAVGMGMAAQGAL